jgi:hypothetical protein
MYNSDIPTRAELPTSAQLIKSTLIAILAAAVILVTIVLPAEKAIDLTGIGRLLKLTEVGEIKLQLAAEAAADRAKDQKPQTPATDKKTGLMNSIASLFGIGSANATEPVKTAQASRKDTLTIVLKPTEGAEWKMTMAKGAQVKFTWNVTGGVVNYDMHSSPAGGGKEESYKTERGLTTSTGVITAAFGGTHGWFWRNRGNTAVTLTLEVEGAFADLKKTS